MDTERDGAGLTDRAPAPFGTLLRRFRQAASLTQLELAERAERSLDAITSLESGRRSAPRASTVAALADALEQAGCVNDDVLAHGQGLGPHVRGCWVVDLVLGRTRTSGFLKRWMPGFWRFR